MPIRITPLTEGDIPGAITTIQTAFADDPYNHWVFSDRENLSLDRNRESLGIRCRWGIRNALFHVAKDSSGVDPERVLGLAMWIPPMDTTRPLSCAEWFWDGVEGWRMWGAQVGMNLWYGRGGLNVKRYYIWKSTQANAQSQLWTDPKGYYFCNIVTVLPSEQGRGIGRALFEEVTTRADAEGRCCYLESSRDVPNTKIYERLGFEKVLDIVCDDEGVCCDLFCMMRRPGAGPGGAGLSLGVDGG